MRLLAYDSNPSHAEYLNSILSKIHGVRSCDIHRSTSSLLSAFEHDPTDVVILDADTHDFERCILRLRETAQRPLIVLCSNLPEVAATAFDLQAADFLLRPYNPVRVEEAVRRLESMTRQRSAVERLDVMSETIEALRQSRSNTSSASAHSDFWIKQRNEIIRVPQSEIIWLEAARGYVYFHLQHRQLLHRISMRELEATLNPAQFLRIHRSGIINTRMLVKTLSDKHGVYAVELNNGAKVRIGRKYRPALTEFMMGFSTPANERLAQSVAAA